MNDYIKNASGGEVPGALGLGQATASNIVNAALIASYVFPIPAAAAIADSGMGRYNVLIWSAIIEAIGAVILVATSWPGALESGAGLPGLNIALCFLSAGAGAFKAMLTPFIADQYEETEFRIKGLKTGEPVVTSRELTITYIYNVFFWLENVAGLICVSTTVLERYVGFWVAYLLPCCIMWLTLAPLLLARRRFVGTARPEQNMVPQAAAALWCGIKSGFSMNAAKPSVQLERHNRVVDWTDNFIDDVKGSLLASKVLLLFPVYWLCFNQMFNNLVSQAGQMITYGIPNDLINAASAISGLIVAPIIQNGLYPFLNRRRIRFGPVARITVGFGLLTLGMAYYAVVHIYVFIFWSI